ncbi:DUF2950 domain-containing protein [Methylomicrobium lacus]|uniref:DUF2950 domain-containing protein n=1 Tax=Methylomicrobium lacus TaxID=136992 RepID=UPI0035A9879B
MMSNKFRYAFSMVIFITLVASRSLSAAPEAESADKGQGFASPEEASKALVDAARDYDKNKIAVLFGSQNAQIFSSGDDVEDANNRADFLKMAEEKSSVENQAADKAILHFGKNDWSFPVPVVNNGGQWRFDAAQGKQEILNRRIGRNELNTLGAMRAYVEAQNEYASIDRDGDEVSEFATKIRSEPGKFDGLYWETAPDQPESPLGPLFAEAKVEGYKVKGSAESATPFHGYLYKILTRQGSNVPGGKYDYIINGNMIAGFALVAFPAVYGSSGIMTFVVNHRGKIYQKNLGPKTTELVAAMKAFDPDASWEAVDENPGQ